MHEFLTQITDRLRSSIGRLEQARRDGDDYTITVVTGEIDTMSRIAREHGLRIPELERLGLT